MKVDPWPHRSGNQHTHRYKKSTYTQMQETSTRTPKQNSMI